MDLREVIANELGPWVPAAELVNETERVLHLLESGERRAVVRTPEGELRLVLTETALLVELPNGARKIRNLVRVEGGW
ncbi:hypothetical protein [Caldinitratiruptor microaerophilus]|uniref:Uncharacterized protein n=1 Tax=Caldinitratiruptor microaerophilus TaxID=671077 RepID=A0AA35CPG8_9FIRM|nr:hypothetical protein [Caldinitratiruptor microaerophilus]BDG61376.1 hypothetical protein caldi_24660 [Caldinitratiruptor microaerophilus]